MDIAAFEELWDNRHSVVKRCRKLVRAASDAAKSEHDAAVKIQSFVRLHFLRIWYNHVLALIIRGQRIYRGHAGRKRAVQLTAKRREWETMSFFHYQACMCQRIFRGYYSRRFRHDFHARKNYIRNILKKSEELRKSLAEHREIAAREEQDRRMAKAQEEFKNVAQNLHHLLSTKSCPGIYIRLQLRAGTHGVWEAQKSTFAARRKNLLGLAARRS